MSTSASTSAYVVYVARALNTFSFVALRVAFVMCRAEPSRCATDVMRRAGRFYRTAVAFERYQTSIDVGGSKGVSIM